MKRGGRGGGGGCGGRRGEEMKSRGKEREEGQPRDGGHVGGRVIFRELQTCSHKAKGGDLAESLAKPCRAC